MAGSNAYEPLHLKYRPQRFADVVGQAAVVQTLANAIRLGRIAPAYLFCGPRGTGKTSSARILAKSLNCERGPTADPCQVCSQCRAITGGSSLDVIEIDAASNTGVDNIRELIERAQFAPVNSRYKVYVIDECHMLSNAAFNALLKTLEEPPAHVVFVLATTDPQRVLPTVISRCQRFDYRRIPLSDMVAHLGEIAAKEGILITPTALQLVAQLSQGGLRDAESLLDQLSLLEGTITPEAVWDLVGAIPERHLLDLIDALAAQDAQGVLTQARQLLEHGKEPLVLVQNLVAFYRDLLLIKTAPQQRELVTLTDPTWEALRQRAPNYSVEMLLSAQSHLRQCEPQIRQSGQPRLWLEIALMDLLCLRQGHLSMRGGEAASVSLPISKSEAVPASIATPPIVKESVSAPPVVTPPLPEPPPPKGDPTAPPEPRPLESPVNLLRPRWDEFLKRLSPITKALLGSGHLHQETPEEITLAFPSKGLAEKIRGKESELHSVLQSLLQRSVRLHLIVQRSSEAIHTTSSRDAAPASSTQGAPPVSSSEHPERVDHPPSERPSPSQNSPQPDPLPTPPRAALTEMDELEEVARRFAEHFNGSLVDLEGVLRSPNLQPLEAVEAEGSPTEFTEEVAEPPLAPVVPPLSRVQVPTAEEGEDLPF
ncbi:DNA polymerase III subunit gamma/tau [Synechococcus sp. Nb3U1]|uniref:DNA polymerase III subunit gamma/tau n=1 Tax=Synechococcus sp. Nb3U1 TaxID=1914529 RepID=UPI001F45C365|nr:DNA polymerase III subunit gamma/tau [Synechococcus sp. Nb3U1]MCF2971150.1 DNA polymerase III subunit gamma/tau [Synechococcus sp. Nb3U1]